ncbi:MAG: 5-formyltetrahydrofolate cyclo-ligase [Cardiobacterium sp.]
MTPDLKQLRRDIRAARRAITPAERQQMSAATAATALAWLRAHADIQRVATFLSLPEEIDTAPLNRALWQAGYSLYLPYVRGMGEALAWLPYQEDTALAPDAAGIPAPPLHEPLDALALDAVITPLVAWDARGTRLGMGGGFYDRTFARKIPRAKPWLLGIAYPCQAVATLPRQPWDVPLDAVASAENLYTYLQEQP